MNISLTPDLENFVKKEYETGLYASVSEIFREALRLLMSKKSVSYERLAMLRQDIEDGLNDTISYDGHTVMNELMERYE